MSSPDIGRTDASPKQNRWVVSPAWDLAYLVATPLLIVPVVVFLSQWYFTPEQISLAVIAFASMGHHLPGFMRAYGDRALLERFRYRFLLAPPLVFMLALLFTPPPVVADALHLPWHRLHGLELVLLLWGTWHGLMQTYGFMRIYDAKRGLTGALGARLDFWLCFTLFTAGVVFSDARVYSIANTMWEAGLPIFGPAWLDGARIAVGVTLVAVLAAYAAQLWRRWRGGQGVSTNKLLLAASTGWVFWYSGMISVNILIGLAIFEIYHAIQYFAIVWIYNRRMLTKAGERFGLLGFLFRDRASMIGLYLACIAAYGSIRYFTMDSSEYVFRGGTEGWQQWLLAFFVTSTFLHFYFDGFIWRVRERKTQEALVGEERPTALGDLLIPGWAHAAKWAVLLVIVALLLDRERQRLGSLGGEAADYESTTTRALARLVPNLPECQMLISRDALARGDVAAALAAAEAAVSQRPRSHAARGDLALALIEAGDYASAKRALEAAIELQPRHWHYHTNLALTHAKLGDMDAAESEYRTAVALDPDEPHVHVRLATFLYAESRPQEALAEYRAALELDPQSTAARRGVIQSLSAAGRHEQAITEGRAAVAAAGASWPALVDLGGALSAAGRFDEALDPLRQARDVAPDRTEPLLPLAVAEMQTGNAASALPPVRLLTEREPGNHLPWFQFGNALYALDKLDQAGRAWEKAIELAPEFAEAYLNLGTLRTLEGDLDAAMALYQAAIARNPDSAAVYYNLGLVLLQQERFAEAARNFQRAKELGYAVPEELLRALRDGQSEPGENRE